MSVYLDDGDVVLHLGECLQVLADLPDESIDSVVTDPPYGLSGEPDVAEVLRHWLAGDDYHHRGGGFMGRTWDSFVPGPAVWRECLRVLRPGGHLLAFGGTRTYDLQTVAIRLAGFEIRDSIGNGRRGGDATEAHPGPLAWIYGSGFPPSKSLDVSKAIDKAAGAEREVVGHTEHYSAGRAAPATPEAAAWQGWGTALKPAWEPVVMARKPLAGTVAGTVLAHGTGALNVDGCRVGMSDEDRATIESATWVARNLDRKAYGDYAQDGTDTPLQAHPAGRWPANVVLSHTPECREVGTRKVKGSAPASGPTLHATRSVAHGAYDGERGEVPSYATETVAAWECHPECPVRRLDEEVGEDGAGPSRFFPTFPADEEDAWTYPEDTSPARATDAPTGAAERASSTTSSGRRPTGSSPTGSRSTTSTRTSRTTESRTSGSSPRLSTSASTPSTTGEETAANGSGGAPSAERGSPSPPPISTSLGEGGPATSAAPAPSPVSLPINESGGRRFCYAPKASTSERDGASHPTVKNLALMRWLVRLVTPPGGLVLDPFAGSGTTLLAARDEGFRAIGIEREAEYCAMAAERYRRRYDPGAAEWAAEADDDQLSLLGGAA